MTCSHFFYFRSSLLHVQAKDQWPWESADLISGPEGPAKQHQMATGGCPGMQQGSFTWSPTGNQGSGGEEGRRKDEHKHDNKSQPTYIKETVFA